MADPTRIVLYGSSLYMTGLAVSLKSDPMLDVIHIPSDSPAMEQYFEPPMPAAIIFELNEVSADLILSQLRTYPGIQLIGVDLAAEDVLLLTGQRVRVVAMADMIRLIAAATGGCQLSHLEDGSATERE